MTKHLNSLARKNQAHQDNTSRSSRPEPQELVPSRYALRVGDIDVLVVSDGVLPLPTATLATNADPAVRAAWLERSEHTSELQSLMRISYAVFCLKKKKENTEINTHTT